MIRTEREKKREIRKLDALAQFTGDETLYTNQIAKKIGVVWPVADRLLNELVDEGKLTGNKLLGYVLYQEPAKEKLRDKVKRLLHIS